MIFILLAILSFSPAVLGADILGVFSITSFSHQIVYRNLMLELNRRGHNMTVITPDPVRDPTLRNYREIDVSFYYKQWRRGMIVKPMDLRISLTFPEALFVNMWNVSKDMCHSYLSSAEVQRLIQEKPKFDLLITEFGFNPCFYAFAKFSDYRHMGMFSFQTSPIVHSNIGNPIDASYIPDVNFDYFPKLTFFQRVRTLIFQIFVYAYYEFAMSAHTAIARQYFGSDLPHLKEIERNLSAMLVNTHFTMAFPRPNVPNMIEIGGPAFHLIKKKLKPLPKILQKLSDAGSNISDLIPLRIGAKIQQ